MSVIAANKDLLLKELRVARVLPFIRKQLPEFLVTEVERQLTIRKKNEKLLDILRKRADGDELLKMCIERSYPQLLHIFDTETSSEDENAPPRPPPPRAAPRKSTSTAPAAAADSYKANNTNTDYKPITAPKVMPKPKNVVPPRVTADGDKLKELQDKNAALQKEIDLHKSKISSLEQNSTDAQLARDIARLRSKCENLEREKDMVVTEKLAMETEQSILVKENEYLKKMKATAVSKREVAQHVEEKEFAEKAKDEAIREAQKLKREYDELERKFNDAVYAKDCVEEDRRRDGRDKSRLEKETERLREELQEERKHAQKVSSSSVPMAQYEKLQDELDESRKEARTLARERDAALQEKNSLLMDRKSGDSAEIRNLHDKISQLNQQLTKLTDEKNNIAFENAMIRDQLNAAVAGTDEVKSDREKLFEQNELMRSDIEHLIHEREGIIAELEAAKQAVAGTDSEKDATIRSLRASLANQQKITDSFEARCNEAERSLIKLREEFKKISERDSALQEDKAELTDQVAALARQVEQLTADRAAALSDYEKSYGEAEGLKAELARLSAEHNNLNTDHEQALEEIQKLHTDIATLERAPPVAAVPAPVTAPLVNAAPPPPPERTNAPPPAAPAAPSPAPPEDEDEIERDWRSEIKVIALDKARFNAASFGFTIGGGIDNPHYKDNPEDSHIYVLKVQRGGVSDGVLLKDDAILSVNGNDLSRVPHQHAVNTLKSADDYIELVIRRKFPPHLIAEVNLSPFLERGLGFSIIGGKTEDVTQDPGIYMAKVLSGGAAEAEGTITQGDRILTINGKCVVSVSRRYAETLLSNLDEECMLRVVKPFSLFQPREDPPPPQFDGRRGRSTEDLRKIPPEQGGHLYGPPAHFKDTRGMNRAGSTPMLHDDRHYQVPPPAAAMPDNRIKRSASQGHLLKNRPDQGYDLQRSRSQDWAPPPPSEPYTPSYPIRRVNIRRPHTSASLGMEIYTATHGQSGIFVNKCDKQGLSYRAGLRCADQILEVNGSNLRNANHDQAVGILSSNTTLQLMVQQSPRLFSEMHVSMNSGFFVRALFGFSGSPENGLTFKEGDVLQVFDRDSMEREGWWLALLLRGATAIQCGEVPSHARAVHVIQQRLGTGPAEPEKKGRKSLLGAFKKGDQRGPGGPDGASVGSEDQYTNDVVPYEPVVRKDLRFTRPIVILGPLTELLNDRLVQEPTDTFRRCTLYTTRQPNKNEMHGRDYYFVTQRVIDDIQAGKNDDRFVECKHMGGFTYYYSANAIKEIATQDQHCVLNVGVHAIERLNSCDLFPVVFFVKFKSPHDIKQQFKGNCSIEQAQKVFEKAHKLERGYRDRFTAVMTGDSMDEIFAKIRDYIRDHGSNVMWVRQN